MGTARSSIVANTDPRHNNDPGPHAMLLASHRQCMQELGRCVTVLGPEPAGPAADTSQQPTQTTATPVKHSSQAKAAPQSTTKRKPGIALTRQTPTKAAAAAAGSLAAAVPEAANRGEVSPVAMTYALSSA